VVFFSRLAEIAGEYLKKGLAGVYRGQPAHAQMAGQGGQERTTTEIVADKMQMLGSRSGMGDAGAREKPSSEGARAGGRG